MHKSADSESFFDEDECETSDDEEEKLQVRHRWKQLVKHFDGDVQQAFEYLALTFSEDAISRMVGHLRLPELPPVDHILGRNFRVLYVYWTDCIKVSNADGDKLRLAKVGSCDCTIQRIIVDHEADPPTCTVQASHNQAVVSVKTLLSEDKCSVFKKLARTFASQYRSIFRPTKQIQSLKTDIESDEVWSTAYVVVSPIPTNDKMECLLRDSISCGRVPKFVIQQLTRAYKSVGASGDANNDSEWVITTDEVLHFLETYEGSFVPEDFVIFEDATFQAGEVRLEWVEHQYQTGGNRTKPRRIGTLSRHYVFDSTTRRKR
jgi:hypothetical protein